MVLGLEHILDLPQIVNSLIGSIVAAMICTPGAIWFFKWATRRADASKYVGAAVTLAGIGILVVLVLAGRSWLEDYRQSSKSHRFWSSVYGMARSFGGDEPLPRLLFLCRGECKVDLVPSVEACIDSEVQKDAERVGHYGSRNEAGLRVLVACMSTRGYAVTLCTDEEPNCVNVPDTGYRNPESSVHSRYKCVRVKGKGIICDFKD